MLDLVSNKPLKKVKINVYKGNVACKSGQKNLKTLLKLKSNKKGQAQIYNLEQSNS